MEWYGKNSSVETFETHQHLQGGRGRKVHIGTEKEKWGDIWRMKRKWCLRNNCPDHQVGKCVETTERLDMISISPLKRSLKRF